MRRKRRSSPAPSTATQSLAHRVTRDGGETIADIGTETKAVSESTDMVCEWEDSAERYHFVRYDRDHKPTRSISYALEVEALDAFRDKTIEWLT